jgi:hypothetical protein
MYENSDVPREFVRYLTLRRAVGFFGILLPWLLTLGCMLLGGCTAIEESISQYYGTDVRDLFVGLLFVIAWFLFAYRGYERKDDIAGDFACIFALGVALFPTTSQSGLIRAVHFACAASLFLVLSYFSICLFTKTDEKGSPTKEKKKRNKVYVACGVIMLVCIACVPSSYAVLSESAIARIKPVFWLESLALSAFGVSWLIKGKTLLQDA